MLPPLSGDHKYGTQCSEVVPFTVFFFENVRYVEFPRNVEDLYFGEIDAFSDVVIANTYVFHPLCCEVF